MICEPVELPDVVSDVDGVTDVDADVDVDVDVESELELATSEQRYYYDLLIALKSAQGDRGCIYHACID